MILWVCVTCDCEYSVVAFRAVSSVAYRPKCEVRECGIMISISIN